MSAREGSEEGPPWSHYYLAIKRRYSEEAQASLDNLMTGRSIKGIGQGLKDDPSFGKIASNVDFINKKVRNQSFVSGKSSSVW